ncbi:MAG: PKD domain-containing protein [Bacteroidia bacterium]|nr:PKD domain-containing protein [Bacteroidia bacterium]
MLPEIKKYFRKTILFLVILLPGISAFSQEELHKKAEELLKKQGLVFRKNEGQWKENVCFQTMTNGTNVYFLKNGLSFGLSREDEEEEHEEHSPIDLPGKKNRHKIEAIHGAEEMEYLVYNVNFLNANSAAEFIAEGETISSTHYFKVDKKIKGAKEYKKLLYKNIYQNIDLRYYSDQSKLKYDYVLKKNADVSEIKMSFAGIKKLHINKKGELVVHTKWGNLIEKIPFSYQEINGQKKTVEVNYFLIDDHTFGFKITGTYDKNTELIIDPIILEWSTYIGGNAPGGGYVFDIAADQAGYVYATGWYNNGFPTTPGSYNSNYTTAGSCGFSGGDEDAYVFKMTPNATSLVYCTYIGGTCKDRGRGIDINAAGEAFITGTTFSTDFPVMNPFQNANAGGVDAFAVRLNSTGSALIYSTYVGGNYNDWAEKIAVNANDEAFICGATLDNGSSPNFPTTAGSLQPAYGGGAFQADGYVAKLNASGNNLLYSTYIGGNGWDWAYSIKVNAADEVFITGAAQTNFPSTAGSFQTIIAGGSDVFISRLNSSGSALVYSTFIGGTLAEVGNSIAINTIGEAFITGRTLSNNYPTSAGCYDASFNGGTFGDIIVSKINSSGTSLMASTYIGSAGLDIGWGIDVSANDEIFIAGYTDNANFPTTTCAIDNSYNGTIDGDYVFLKLNATASVLKYSTFIGGSDQDYWEPKIKLIGTPCDQHAICSGTSHSTNIPTTPGVMQPVKLNGQDDQPTILKLRPIINPGFTINPNPVCGNTPITFTDTTTDCGLWDTLTIHNWNFGDGGTASGVVVTHTYATQGTYTVQLIVGCPLDTVYQTVTVSNGITSTTASDSSSCGINNGTASVNPTSGISPYTFSWSNGNANDTIFNLAPGTYTVGITDNVGCTGTNTVVVFPSNATPPATSPINGNDSICANAAAMIFSVINSSGSNYVWTVPSACTIVSGQGTNSIIVNWGNTSGIVTCTETNACGVAGTPVNFLVTVLPAPQVNFVADTVSGCSPLTVNFTDQTIVSAGTIENWLWIFGDGNTSTQQNPTNIYLNSGAYNISLTVTNDLSCVATYTATNYVNVFPDPLANFTSNSGEVTSSAPTVVFTNTSVGGVDWLWEFGDGSDTTLMNPSHTYEDAGNYLTTLTVTNQYGCIDSITQIIVIKDEFTFYVPNAFTPDGNGINDFFRGEGRGFSNYHLEIYDRWGERIYESDDYNLPWTGTTKKSETLVQIDVYVYKIKLNDNTGKERSYVGHVSVVR